MRDPIKVRPTRPHTGSGGKTHGPTCRTNPRSCTNPGAKLRRCFTTLCAAISLDALSRSRARSSRLRRGWWLGKKAVSRRGKGNSFRATPTHRGRFRTTHPPRVSLGALYGTLHDRLVGRRFRQEPAHPFVVAAYCGPHIVLVWLLPCLALPGFPSRLLYRLPSAAAAAAAAAAASTAQSTATGLRATVSGP